jgi:uncharacterized protein
MSGAGLNNWAERIFQAAVRRSVEPDEATVKQVIEFTGGRSSVSSTDYPHGDSKYPRAVEHFLKLPVSDEEKRKIL